MLGQLGHGVPMKFELPTGQGLGWFGLVLTEEEKWVSMYPIHTFSPLLAAASCEAAVMPSGR
jgi:hypothetical protein